MITIDDEAEAARDTNRLHTLSWPLWVDQLKIQRIFGAEPLAAPTEMDLQIEGLKLSHVAVSRSSDPNVTITFTDKRIRSMAQIYVNGIKSEYLRSARIEDKRISTYFPRSFFHLGVPTFIIEYDNPAEPGLEGYRVGFCYMPTWSNFSDSMKAQEDALCASSPAKLRELSQTRAPVP